MIKSGLPTDPSLESNALHPITPTTRLLQLITGHWVAQSVYVVAKLAIADRLANGPKTAETLAAEVDAAPENLYRVLRMLGKLGVFHESETREFSLAPVGRCLITGAPGGMRSSSIAMGEELYQAWSNPLHPVLTGGSAFEKVFGASTYQYRATHPLMATTFNEAMTEWSIEATAAILRAYDFTQFGAIADIGGGHGAFLISLLNAAPGLRGTIMELPYVAAGAQEQVTKAGLTSRCDVMGGDLFVDPWPRDVDAYVIKNTIESFDDSKTFELLSRCRSFMNRQTRLLIIGWVIRKDQPLGFTDLFDSHLLIALGGRIRTESEYNSVLARADLRLSRIVRTESAIGESILECTVQ